MSKRAEIEALRARRDAALDMLAASIDRLERTLVERGFDVRARGWFIAPEAPKGAWCWEPYGSAETRRWRILVHLRGRTSWEPLTTLPLDARLQVVFQLSTVVAAINNAKRSLEPTLCAAIENVNKLIEELPE